MALLASQLVELGLSGIDAEKLIQNINNHLEKTSPEETWGWLTETFFNQDNTQENAEYSDKKYSNSPHPFSLHLLLYKTIYPNWANMPAPAWFPTDPFIKTTNLFKFMQTQQIKNYSQFHQWSVKNVSNFWESVVKLLKIQFDKPYTEIVNLDKGLESPLWFPDSKLNIVNSCFQNNSDSEYKSEDKIAIIAQNETGELQKTTYQELNTLSNTIAKAILKRFKKGDNIAIDMPMTSLAVAIYLGIIKAGCTVVSIADSFAAEEIAIRFKITKVCGVFCQDYIIRNGKRLACYEKILEAVQHKDEAHSKLNPQIVIVTTRKTPEIQCRKEDKKFDDFIKTSENLSDKAVSCDPSDTINILFSSGTTGEPKAIPWTHTSPIKCASDAYFHHNIQSGDIFCWPSNLGWMMGPWLIFACLLNKATLALFDGMPNTRAFGEFIQKAKVTLLGVVPTMIKTWRSTECMEGLDWRLIKLFTSTGECSNTEDMLYLNYLSHYCPIIEYCGGTEISGSYITSTVIHPSAPAAFTTPALGLDFVIIDEQGQLSDNGEVALIPPSIGLSTQLINKDHHNVYYQDMPMLDNELNKIILRRHGDHIIRYSNGYYRLQGRVDDTMNLSGIKVSAAEIERVLNTLDGVFETAAVAIEPDTGGPSELIIFVLLDKASIDTVLDKHDEKKSAQNAHLLEELKTSMQTAIREHLNPLFKISQVKVVDSLPRTASNKMMRRSLRDNLQKR